MSFQSFVKGVFYKLGYSLKRLRPAGKVRTAAAPAQTGTRDIRSMIHAVDPYEGFDASAYPLDLQGWGSETPAFREILTQKRPKLIVEVGTWKGGSAIHMAEILATEKIDAHMVCIDTWLGALEFWTDHSDPDRYKSLRLKNGWPQVYYQFLANVVHKGHQARITPFPQTSATGAMWLAAFGIKADVIYVDGSHEEEDVYADVLGYWEALAPGGVLFGDDWGWAGVRLAVQRFAGENGLTIRHVADKWVLEKK